MYFVEDYKNLVSDLSDRVKQYHNIDEFILDDVRDVNVFGKIQRNCSMTVNRSMVTTDSETVLTTVFHNLFNYLIK